MRTRERYKKNKDILEWLDTAVLALALLALLYTFGVRMVRVDGTSMEPTLLDGERLLISSWHYTPAKGDIVVVDSYTPYGATLVKRVIAMGGDTVDIDFAAGIVYVNGEALDEPYTAAPTYLVESATFPLTVPEGCLFLMGDNRNRSKDSRSLEIGCVDERDVLGKALFRLLPFDRLGAVQ